MVVIVLGYVLVMVVLPSLFIFLLPFFVGFRLKHLVTWSLVVWNLINFMPCILIVVLFFRENRLTSSSLIVLAKVLISWPRKLRVIDIGDNDYKVVDVVRKPLEKVFDFVFTEAGENDTTFADYVSEM